MHTRKPARVLPEPVGAAIRVSWPAAIVGPGLLLGRGGALGEAAPEPLGHRRVHPGQGGVHGRPRGEEGEGHRSHVPILADGCDTQTGAAVPTASLAVPVPETP